MEYVIEKHNFRLVIESDGRSARIKQGRFGDIEIVPSPIFSAVLEKLSDKSEYEISSESVWKTVDYIDDKLIFTNLETYGDIVFSLTLKQDENGISWFTDVKNGSVDYSVIAVDYPVPTVTADSFDMFVPSCSGRAVKDVGNVGFKMKDTYPHHYSSMQYFAYYGKEGGIYLGIHDENACMKDFVIESENKISNLKIRFPAIGAGEKKNCFSLGGYIRWQAFSGDWYDATMLYADFVYKHAKWLPEITDKGRPDLPERLKNIAYWIVEYMLNSPEQRDVRPKKLGSVSQKYGKDYWIDAPIELQEKLGVPVGYHVYNWHKNPFNINYPHFTPKDEFFRGKKAFEGKNINVMPYINGVSWETNDADEGFEINFENTGKFGAAIDKNGNPITVSYPQQKENGLDTRLSPMCPSFPKWRTIVNDLARMLENDLGAEGIYFDEIAAHNPHPCRSKNHAHLPGGGSYWSDGYNELMETVKRKKKEGVFYVSESSGEPYMKSFDGYLTWLWRQPDDVPAFSAIYAGYIVMLGRFSDGIDKEDDAFFKQNIAKALLYGQQPGWLFADVVYNEYRTEFLKRFVQMRYKHSDTFSCSKMLRPPKIVKGDPTTLMAGGWRSRDNSKTVLFVTNTADFVCDYTLRINNDEYKLNVANLPKNAKVCEKYIEFSGKINANDCIDIEIRQ